MYTTTGIDAIATITELRSKTTSLIEHVRKNQGALLIQKNNEPFAVLLDWRTYNELMNASPEVVQPEDREPKRRARRRSAADQESADKES